MHGLLHSDIFAKLEKTLRSYG